MNNNEDFIIIEFLLKILDMDKIIDVRSEFIKNSRAPKKIIVPDPNFKILGMEVLFSKKPSEWYKVVE